MVHYLERHGVIRTKTEGVERSRKDGLQYSAALYCCCKLTQSHVQVFPIPF